jgi:SHS2 domain-containing protein
MTRFKVLDISGDVSLVIYGTTTEELFQNAALGLYSLITEPSSITDTEKQKVHLESDNEETLLVKWLNELIFLFDTYGFVGKTFSILYQKNHLSAYISGGIFDEERDEQRLLIKAATYHNLSLKKESMQYEAMVMFDI